MAEQRPVLFFMLAFATSLGALSAAAGTAALRCDDGSECSYELTLAIAAFAPACLIALVALLLIRMRAEIRWLRTALLAVGVGVAFVPLATFLLRDLWLLPAFVALLAALIVLVLWGEREAVESERAIFRAEAPAVSLPPHTHAEVPAPEVQRPPMRARVDATLALLDQLTSLNGEIIRLCQAMPRTVAKTDR